jgi:hypothetical protein
MNPILQYCLSKKWIKAFREYKKQLYIFCENKEWNSEKELSEIIPSQQFQIVERVSVTPTNCPICLPIPYEWKTGAEILANEMGTLKNSIESGKGNVIGFLGEYIYSYLFQEPSNRSYEYDFCNSFYSIDCKTKACGSTPFSTYSASIAEYNTRQLCDLYVFLRVQKESMGYGWLIGYMPKEEYFQKAQHLKEGEIDPSNNFVVRANCFNLKYESLYSFKRVVYKEQTLYAF